MRPIFAVVWVVTLIGSADACPRLFCCCRPQPVVVAPQAAEVVRLVEDKKPEPEKAVIAPEGWCHIRGRIVFDGDPIPEQKEIPKSGGAYTEEWVVNKANRGVKNVVVWLAPEPTPAELERLKSTGANRLRTMPNFKPDQVFPGLNFKIERSMILGEPMRAYVPHVMALQAGSDLYIRNLSKVPDNPKWTSANNGEYAPLVPPGQVKELKDLKSERFPINVASSIYPWMKAYVWVFDHPYFAVTDTDGNFTIRFAPKGNLRLIVWQEDMGYRNGRWGEAIQVPNGQLNLGEIKIKPAK